MSDQQREAGAPSTDVRKLKVFVSYSRADVDFADELVAGLEFARQFDISMDRHSILEGEEWKKRLGTLIADADTIVFLLSPDSVASEICGWELDEALRLSKRIVPVLVRPAALTAATERLGTLNYVRFDEGRSFMAGLNGLVRALSTDVEWVREHTRLMARAMEWHATGRRANRLLSGSDIEAAKAWLSRRPKDAPDVTDLHLSFIKASEQAETERTNAERQRLEEMAAAQAASAMALEEREVAVRALSRRTTMGLLSAGGLTVGAAGLAWWGNDAERRFQRERQRVAEAEARALQEAIDKEAMRTDIAGQLTAFASSPDQVASDGPPGGNSPYTKALTEELGNRNASFQVALARATQRVLSDANGRQRPFFSTDLSGEIYLFRKPPDRRLRALVVSCDQVSGFRIPNAERDALVWEKLLLQAGFDTKRLVNPTLEEWRASSDHVLSDPEGPRGDMQDHFVQRVGFVVTTGPAPKSLAFVFFAGVGIAVGDDLFLALNETNTTSSSMVRHSSINLTHLKNDLRATSAASVLVLDTNFSRFNGPGADTRVNR
jgi:hypothetical protein